MGYRKHRVCFPFIGDSVGGSHISALLLIEGLRQNNVEVVVVLHVSGPLESELKHRGIPWVWAPKGCEVGKGRSLSSVIEVLSATKRLTRFVRNHAFDVVHTNDGRIHKTWGLAARLAGAAFVLHYRIATWSFGLVVYSQLATKVIMISEYCKRSLPVLMRRRSSIVENPFDFGMVTRIDKSVARHELRSQIGAGEKSLMIGFVGNFIHQKRASLFVEVANEVRRRISEDVRFPMFGDPRELRGDIERRIRELGMDDRIHLMGTRFPIEPVLAGLDVYVAPAVREGFGRTLVEAMGVGVPVIAADDGGHREIIREGVTGYLVRRDNKESFADRVVDIVNDRERTVRMSEAAFSEVQGRFSVQRHVEGVVGIYNSLVS